MIVKTKEAREKNIIGQEKDAISIAWNSLTIDKELNGLDIKNVDFENELNNYGNNIQVSYEDDDENKNFIVNFKNTQHEYIVDRSGNILLKGINSIDDTPIVISSIKSWTKDANTDFHQQSIKNIITEVEFVDLGNKTAPTELNDNSSWDVSENGDKSIIAWLESTKLYIGGNGGVKANIDSSHIFNNFPNLNNINFGNKFDTSSATTMSGMFLNSSNLMELDLRSFNTDNVTDMSEMFNMTNDGSSKLTNIMFGDNWNTSNVIYMNHMFSDCGSLTTLDLSTFDTKRVTKMNNMFASCKKLETVYVTDKFVVNNVSSYSYMFDVCNNLVGGNGTKFGSDKLLYARIDKNEQPGYFTDKRQNLRENNQELEYIESTGTQYINTGFIPNQDTRIVVDFKYTNNNQGYRFTGSENVSMSKQLFRFGTSLGKSWMVGYGSQGYKKVGSPNTNRHLLDFNKNVITLDGESLTSFNYETFTSYGNAYIFSINSNNIADLAPAKLYSYKLYDNGSLIRDLIPVHNTIIDSVGLYDVKNNKFYCNNGTGEFIAGPEKVSN